MWLPGLERAALIRSDQSLTETQMLMLNQIRLEGVDIAPSRDGFGTWFAGEDVDMTIMDPQAEFNINSLRTSSRLSLRPGQALIQNQENLYGNWRS